MWKIANINITLYFGQTGVGKTSLLRAGFIPRLQKRWGREVTYLSLQDNSTIAKEFQSCLYGLTKRGSISCNRRSCRNSI